MKSEICQKCADKSCFGYDHRVTECVDFQPMTNADRIRAMTDEELAKYLCKSIREGVMMAFPSAHYSNADIEELNQNWLDWLKQEAKYD